MNASHSGSPCNGYNMPGLTALAEVHVEAEEINESASLVTLLDLLIDLYNGEGKLSLHHHCTITAAHEWW